MPVIALSFAPEMEEAILAGKKCCTTRREKKGVVGDTFIVQDRVYRLCQVHSCALLSVAEIYCRAEGFESKESVLEFWRQHVGDTPLHKSVWIHFFAYVGPVEGELPEWFIAHLKFNIESNRSLLKKRKDLDVIIDNTKRDALENEIRWMSHFLSLRREEA